MSRFNPESLFLQFVFQTFFWKLKPLYCQAYKYFDVPIGPWEASFSGNFNITWLISPGNNSSPTCLILQNTLFHYLCRVKFLSLLQYIKNFDLYFIKLCIITYTYTDYICVYYSNLKWFFSRQFFITFTDLLLTKHRISLIFLLD